MWRPFFNKGYVNPGLGSIQVDAPVYLPIDMQYALNLQDKYVNEFFLYGVMKGNGHNSCCRFFEYNQV